MADTTSPENDEATAAWMRATLDRATADITALGALADQVIEARPLWSIPGNVLIGQARPANDPSATLWFISGNLPTDVIGADAASTPREALRHFSMKWQLDAERYADPETRRAHGLSESHDWKRMVGKLVARAEELYVMAEDDRLWPPPEKS